jgi:hypothetical protein
MKRFVGFLICAMFLSGSLFAQRIRFMDTAPKDTVAVKGLYSGGIEGELNTAVQTAIDAGTLSNTAFKLNLYDWYVLTGTLEVPAGQTLDIVAPSAGNNQNAAPPQILWTASSSVTKQFLIQVYGHLIMKNIWIRYADAAGIQTGTPIVFDGDTASVGGGTKQYGVFENCVFEYMPCPAVTASGSVCVRSKHFNGSFTNCYFRNCTDRHYMYYGRAVSFPFDVPGYHTDSVSFENCTFANMGYVYMQERSNYADNVHFNHCTFYGIVMHSLEYGWWYKLSVNNCLFVNAYMLGYIPGQGASAAATITITKADSIGFTVPFTDADRHILFTNSAYYMDNWLVDWMRGGWDQNYGGTPWRPNPKITSVGNSYSVGLYKARDFSTIPYPRQMMDTATVAFFDSMSAPGVKAFPYVNKANLYDVTDLREAVNPGFITPPLNLEPLKYFLKEKWDTNLDSMWAYMPEAGQNQVWPLPENLAYTNEMLKTAGMGGFPLGDLYHWWNPSVRDGATDQYSAWLAQAETERTKITTWLDTGDPNGTINGVENLPGNRMPSGFTLNQNYPNPFNPVTQITYSVPVTGHVSLEVFNSIGQKVAVLFDGNLKAGKYAATFDGTGVTGGIYFYRLQSEDVSITRKLILMK